MRKTLAVWVAAAALVVPIALSGTLHSGYAQITAPQGDEFNSNVFAAPFHLQCGSFAPNCPDPEGSTTWSLDGSLSPGALRIWTQFGSLVGTTAQASNNARNLVLEPFNPGVDWQVTTSVRFPSAITNAALLGQTAGLLVYQDDDDFIYVGRVLSGNGSQIQFLQESGGVDLSNSVTENAAQLFSPLYLRLTKVGNLYEAAYSYDNVNFTPITPGFVPAATATAIPTATGTATTPVATATAVPAPLGYTVAYNTPQLGLFAWGGTNAAVSTSTNQLPADFDWIRVGNSATPAATPLPTSTTTAVATSTATATTVPSATAVPPTSTPVPTATALPTATNSPTPTPTNTPLPTPTPTPVHHKYTLSFHSISLWYHTIREGTTEHLIVQANHHSTLGIWVHVLFPSGQHIDYYTNTDDVGHWNTTFNIPSNAINRNSNQGWVLLQLWHHKTTVQRFMSFTIIH